jgi:(R,R)-butanediol dehydrogenase/meso-butanediol dehydrogenase/diacetyl reductase
MKAVVFRRPHGLVYEEVPDYKVGDDEVLVRVANVGFCGSDHSLVAGGLVPDGYILGHEISGVVVEKGKAVEGAAIGSRVCIRPTFCGQCSNCLVGKQQLCRVHRRTTGIGDLPGGFAEYVKVFPQMLIPIPDGVDSRNSALAETFASALHAINCTGAEKGSALVMGGGPIGLSTIRLLKILGYAPIVLFEPVQEKRNIALLYGADQAFDPWEENLNQTVLSLALGGFDKIFECSGITANINRALHLSADNGQVCIVSVLFKPIEISEPYLINFKEIRLTASISNTHEENKQCLVWMASGLIDAGPMISDLVPLEQLPEIYRTRIDPGLAIKVLLQAGDEF